VAVADEEQRLGDRDGQVQRRAGDELAAVDVAAADRAGRDRRVLAGGLGWQADDPEERCRADPQAELVVRRARRDVDVPEERAACGRVGQSERPVQLGVDAAGAGVAPVARTWPG
jgi:hypothetical protein